MSRLVKHKLILTSMMLNKCILCASICLSLFAVANAHAATSETAETTAKTLSLASMFNSGMVLQQQTDVPVWGRAAANSALTLQFADQTLSTTSDENGAWKIILKPMPANAHGATLSVSCADERISIDDILIGEVWIAAGQSNMNVGGPNKDTGYYPFYTSPADADSIAPIRFLRYGWGASLEPLEDNTPGTSTNATWKHFSTDNLQHVNIPEQFARILRDKLKVPIGILHVSVSGTNQAAWMHRQTLESFPSKKKENFYEEYLELMTEKLAKDKKLQNWEGYMAAMDKWLSNPQGRSPATSTVVNHPTALYNTRIHPLAPFAVKGVIWHQGEGGPGGPYGERLVKMIQQWRERLGQDFYFIFGTLSDLSTECPPLSPSVDYFYRSGTNRSIHTALKHFGDDKKVSMVDFYDLGDTDTHWLNKNEAGRRMALAALDLAYDQQHIYSGPRMTTVTADGPALMVTFTLTGEGLQYKPSLDGISGIVVKSKDGPYVWANVEIIEKHKVKITHPEGDTIESMGYAINRNPHETLFNSEGLPATPFSYQIDRIPYEPVGPKLIQLEGEKKNRGKLSVAHVTESGYRFQIVPVRGTDKNQTLTVKAIIPNAWSDQAEVYIADQTVAFTKESNGTHTVLIFNAAQNGSWITVCKSGHADQFMNIRRY